MSLYELAQTMTQEPAADLAAQVLAEAGQTLLVEAQQGEDLEEPLHLYQVDSCDGFVQLLGNDHPQLLLRLLKQQQAGVHAAACVEAERPVFNPRWRLLETL